MEEILNIKKLLEEDRPERWDALPDIDLYMDQVVSYLPRQSTGGKPPAITSAMINNYVKDGLLPRANGKRYQKEHLVYLTAIGLFKNVLTVRDIRLLIENLHAAGEEEVFYEKLLHSLNRAFNEVDGLIDPALSEEELTLLAAKLALNSIAAKTACEQLLAVVREKHPSEDPKARKEREKEEARRAKEAKKAAES